MSTDKSDDDLTNLVDRLEAFEERFGVSIEAMRAGSQWRGNLFGGTMKGIVILGQLRPRDGLVIKQDIELVADAYDRAGRILNTGKVYFVKEKFYGFETFEIFFWTAPETVTKICIYPKAP